MGTVSSTELVELSLARDSWREGAQWHCGQLCQELLAQDEVVGVGVGGGGGDGGLGVRDGRGQGRGVRLPDGPGLLRQEVRLHVRWGQKWHVRPEGFAGGRPGGSSSSYTFNRLRSKPLLRAKPMVKLAPKKMGSTYFNTFMAVP